MSVEMIKEIEGTKPVKVLVKCSYCEEEYELDRGNYRHRRPKSCYKCISKTKLNSDGTKTCSRCNTPKELSEYTITNKKYGSMKSRCKDCVREVDKERFKAHPEEEKKKRNEASRKSHLKRTYGITPEEFKELADKADNKCQICDKETNYHLHIDHCHTTGHIRGVLCNECNTAIGFFQESTAILLNAISYIEKDYDGNKKVPGYS